jgi:mRNA-degrading endonuclease toxin of MazEF toxin-antitoxin module
MAWKRGTKPHGWYPRRGDVCLFDLDKERPALVVSTDALNRFSQDVCVVPISKVEHKQFSLRPKLKAGEGGLDYDSWVKCDQVTTLEKQSAVYPALGFLTRELLETVENAIRTALELPEKK